MPPSAIEQRPPGSREGSLLVLLATAFAAWLLTLAFVPALLPAAIPTAYSIPLFLMIELYLAVRVLVAGAQALPWGMFISGCGFVVGGAGFDIFATVHHSPNLNQEYNPVARLLLDSDHSIGFVYAYGAFCQTALASVVCVIWGGFLRHRESIVNSVRTSTGLMQLLKALTGGAGLTWRQWLCPLKTSELPDFSYYVWVFTAMLVAAGAYRWYLGLEWFGFSPVNSTYVGVIAMLCGIAAYVAWVHREVQRLNRELQASGQTECNVSE